MHQRNLSQKTEKKEVLITHRDGEFVFLVADGSAKLSGKDYEFQEPTLRREYTVRGENLGENVMLQKWRQKNGSTVFMLASAKTKRDLFLRAERCGDLISAEHKVLYEGRESRNNHRYAVVVHVLATQWNPCQTKTSQETGKNLRKFPEPSQKPKVIFGYRQYIRNWQAL